MNPYPGESLYLYDIAAVTAGVDDFTASADLTIRGVYGVSGGTGSRTFVPGTEYRGWVTGQGNYQDGPDINASFSWVAEVLSGSGTLRVAEAADYDYGNTSLAPLRELGTLTIDGPGTYVIPSGFTLAEGWSRDFYFSPIFEALSGSFVVQQLKLRLWPPGGPLGGWSSRFPAFSDPRTRTRLGGAFTDVNGGASGPLTAVGEGADPESAHAAMLGAAATAAAYAEHAQTVAVYSGGGPVTTATISATITDLNHDAHRVSAGGGVALWKGPSDSDLAYGAVNADEGLGAGIDYIRVPTEVAEDVDAVRYAQTDGDPEWTWDAAAFDLYVSWDGADSPNPQGGYNLTIDGGTWPTTSIGAGNFTIDGISPPVSGGTPLRATGAGDGPPFTVSVPTTSRDVLLALFGSVATDIPDFSMWHGGVLGLSTDFRINGSIPTSLTGVIARPPYRVWLPAPARTSRLRQFPVPGFNTPSSPLRRIDENVSGGRRGPTAIR